MFERVLNAFVVPYWITVAMYAALFIFGLGGFHLTAVSRRKRPSRICSDLCRNVCHRFLTFFISRPLRSLEQNVVLITWLGVIYNTYWNQLNTATNPKTFKEDLEAFTKTAIKDLNWLLVRQTYFASERPGHCQ